MRRVRPPFGSGRMTITWLAAVSAAVVYLYTVVIGMAAIHDGSVKAQILIGGAIVLGLEILIARNFVRTYASNLRRFQEAARKVADGNFETTIPVASGQLGQLARTFNEMQRRLAELDRARKQFIANASHELRTPIFSLGGFVELLEEEEDLSPEERAEFVRTMRQQIERLTKLTTDLLDLSQLDSGAVVMNPSTVDLTALAREVTKEFGARAELRGSRLELRTPTQPAIALGDPERVRQIIRILLDNALTHTPEGTTVTVTTYSANGRAELTVSDEGPGIPQRVQKRIFERFYTADSAGGSGLGLAIATELAQRMEGEITISSSRRFTAFTLDLPPGKRRSAPRPAQVPARTAA